MKHILSPVVSLLSLALLVSAHGQQAQSVKPAAANPPPAAGNTANNQGSPKVEVEFKTPAAREARDKFNKLTAEERERFEKLMAEGQAFLAQRRATESLEKLNEAESLYPLSPDLLNLKGAALVNIRDFERAAKYFDKAYMTYPGFWQTQFNLAEMRFVGKNWVEAEKMFKELLGAEVQLDGSTKRLVEYKIILCLIKQDKTDEAQKKTAAYDIYDDTPIFYYATAALHYHKNQKKEAEEWVANARSVYVPQLNSVFEDSLMELGWLFVF